MNFDTEVIVVGAGPAGSRVAQQLAANGRDVLFLERRNTMDHPVCCTGIISTECLEQFDIEPDVVLRRYQGALIHSPGGTTISARNFIT